MGKKQRGVVSVSVDDGEEYAVFLNGELVMGTEDTPDEVASRLAGILNADLVVFDLKSGDELPESWDWPDLVAHVRGNWNRILAEGRPGPGDVVMRVAGRSTA